MFNLDSYSKLLIISLLIMLVDLTKQWSAGDQCEYFNLGLNSFTANLIEKGKFTKEFDPTTRKDVRTVVNRNEDFFYIRIDPFHLLTVSDHALTNFLERTYSSEAKYY